MKNPFYYQKMHHIWLLLKNSDVGTNTIHWLIFLQKWQIYWVAIMWNKFPANLKILSARTFWKLLICDRSNQARLFYGGVKIFSKNKQTQHSRGQGTLLLQNSNCSSFSAFFIFSLWSWSHCNLTSVMLEGRGELHNLTLICCPPSQVLVHFVHPVHALHPPACSCWRDAQGRRARRCKSSSFIWNKF